MHSYTCTECDWTGSGTSYMDLCPLCSSSVDNKLNDNVPDADGESKKQDVQISPDENVFNEHDCGWRK